MRLRTLAAALAAIASLADGLHAETLYSQDFQSGQAPEWAASGRGDVRLSVYGKNVSLKFAGRSSSRVMVPTGDRRAIVVRARIAAMDLAPADACFAEVSADQGASWLTVLSVRHGQDDGVSLVGGAFASPALDGRAKLILRFRADLSRPGGACFGDDVSVTGDAPLTLRSGPLDLAALSGERLDAPSPMTAFTPSPRAGAPQARFEGRLTLIPRQRPDGAVALAGARFAPNDPLLAWPGLTLDLVQDGNRLIPATRGPIPGDNPEWEWLAAPGQVWSEPGDGGFTRAVLPVALEERNANCVHAGRVLLLFKPDGTVSRAATQFDAQTCAYFRFDAWSLVPAAYAPRPMAGAAALIARDRAERAARAPAKTLADLTAAYPAIDVAALARAAGPFAVWGLDDGAAHYAAPCPTRAGDDSWCAERALPSYSTAKTLVGMQGLLRLETLRPGASLERVADHVPACAAAGGWGDVRLIDLLDMASGHFVSSGPETDENAPAMDAFFGSTTAAAKLAFACAQPRKAAPGKVWVYHTADSFLLGAAMTDVLRKTGLGRDEYDDLIRPIWSAIGQSAALDATRRTYDAAAQPFTGWGLAYTRDDTVRAARFLDGGGQARGSSGLDQRLLAEAMQRTEPGGGFVALGLANLRYRHGLWARNVGPLVACRHAVWAPYMSGYGGISVVMFPNGVRFYAFNDENQFDWAAAVPEVDKIRPLCR